LALSGGFLRPLDICQFGKIPRLPTLTSQRQYCAQSFDLSTRKVVRPNVLGFGSEEEKMVRIVPYKKTGTCRQAELVIVILTALPGCVGAPRRLGSKEQISGLIEQIPGRGQSD
jgi:hypothetical protein